METGILLAALSDIWRRIQVARKWQKTASPEESERYAWQLETLEQMYSEIFARLAVLGVDWKQHPDGSIGTLDVVNGDFYRQYSQWFYDKRGKQVIR